LGGGGAYNSLTVHGVGRGRGALPAWAGVDGSLLWVGQQDLGGGQAGVRTGRDRQAENDASVKATLCEKGAKGGAQPCAGPNLPPSLSALS
jgi:hypothetical protein